MVNFFSKKRPGGEIKSKWVYLFIYCMAAVINITGQLSKTAVCHTPTEEKK
jgi:hypothetical protein